MCDNTCLTSNSGLTTEFVCKHVHLSNTLPNTDCPLKSWINEDSLNHMFNLICPTKKYITWQKFDVYNLQISILLKCVQKNERPAGSGLASLFIILSRWINYSWTDNSKNTNSKYRNPNTNYRRQIYFCRSF